MSKAKACEEMILYERPVSSNKRTQGSPLNTGRKENPREQHGDYAPPQMKALQEFEAALIAYIKDTTLVENMQNHQETAVDQ